jgi:hypothetical protein
LSSSTRVLEYREPRVPGRFREFGRETACRVCAERNGRNAVFAWPCPSTESRPYPPMDLDAYDLFTTSHTNAICRERAPAPSRRMRKRRENTMRVVTETYLGSRDGARDGAKLGRQHTDAHLGHAPLVVLDALRALELELVQHVTIRRVGVPGRVKEWRDRGSRNEITAWARNAHF